MPVTPALVEQHAPELEGCAPPDALAGRLRPALIGPRP
jgi:hypothetical protein